MLPLLSVLMLLCLFLVWDDWLADVNECQENSVVQCQYYCTNLEGSFECSCPAHLVLARDGLTCEGQLELELQVIIIIIGDYKAPDLVRRDYTLSLSLSLSLTLTHTHTHTHARTHTRTHAHTHARTYTHTKHRHARTHARTHTHACTH